MCMSFVIGGLQKTSFLDYPQKIACIVFTPACNFRCGYCHNPELNKETKAVIELSEFFDFLKSRVGKLDGVVITGGEPTLQKNLYSFIKEIKDLGFCVKLDTNGSNPEILKKLVNDKLVDYVAMDIKASLDRYQEVTSSKINTENIKESINFLINGSVDYEFRTTVVKEQLKINDFEKISELIKGAKKYFLQKFVASKTLDEKFMTATTYTSEEFKAIEKIFENKVKSVQTR